jgi:hypothetical protein
MHLTAALANLAAVSTIRDSARSAHAQMNFPHLIMQTDSSVFNPSGGNLAQWRSHHPHHLAQLVAAPMPSQSTMVLQKKKILAGALRDCGVVAE